MPEPNRRRSERLLITVPIRVEGSNPRGEKFSESTRTLIINRHGARIQLKHPVAPGSVLRITNLVADRGGEFRVVGPTRPLTEAGGEWGVECKEESRNIWGIDFPPSQDQESLCSGLLECRKCHRTALTPLSLVEYDVLSTAGLLTRQCEACAQATTWGYSEQQIGMSDLSPEPESAAGESGAAGANRRVHKRVALKLPVRVRNYYGSMDFAKTENVSKGGLCFISDKSYEIGEGVQVICPYDPTGHGIEIRGRVVRRYGEMGGGRRIYGIRYEKET